MVQAVLRVSYYPVHVYVLMDTLCVDNSKLYFLFLACLCTHPKGNTSSVQTAEMTIHSVFVWMLPLLLMLPGAACLPAEHLPG